jgi:hypothetical protein
MAIVRKIDIEYTAGINGKANYEVEVHDFTGGRCTDEMFRATNIPGPGEMRGTPGGPVGSGQADQTFSPDGVQTATEPKGGEPV